MPAPDASVCTAWVRHGAKTRLDLKADEVTYVYPAGNEASEITVVADPDRLEAPVKRGESAGRLLIYADDKLIAERQLTAAEDIEEGWLPSYIYISNGAAVIILKVLGAAALILIMIRTVTPRRRKIT